MTLPALFNIALLALCSRAITTGPTAAYAFVIQHTTPSSRFIAQKQHGLLSTTRLFLSSKAPPKNKRTKKNKGRSPSRVVDPDGPTPDLPPFQPEEVNPDDIPELQEVMSDADLPRPIPHQPWRRGETNGCEAPIAAEWRREAEQIITKAANLVGGSVLDVTWFLTTVLVTLDPDVKPEQDFGKSQGPPIRIEDPEEPIFHDPVDPNPDDIWGDEDGVLYQKETEEEIQEAKERLHNSYAPKDPVDDDPNDPHVQDEDAERMLDLPLYMNEETRDHVAIHITEEQKLRNEESERPMDVDTIRIDTAALSTIAKAILDGLELEEDKLHILSRHELVLTSPGPPDVLETQRQFDAYRDNPVIVETQDPFDSNRTLKGRLVDRNAMDLIINQQGRMVTIPLNFVKCVRLPANLMEDEEEEYEEEE